MPIGYSFPFQVSSGSVGYFQMSDSELAAVENNLKVLLLTNKGERPMRFNFGCNLREFLFEQLRTEELTSRIADRIIQQIERWMPFVTLTQLNILFSEDEPALPQNAMMLRLTFKLNNRAETRTLTQLIG